MAAGYTIQLRTNTSGVVLEQALVLATRFPALWDERWPQRGNGTCLSNARARAQVSRGSEQQT
jgi:hypothetical protein